MKDEPNHDRRRGRYRPEGDFATLFERRFRVGV